MYHETFWVTATPTFSVLNTFLCLEFICNEVLRPALRLQNTNTGRKDTLLFTKK